MNIDSATCLFTFRYGTTVEKEKQRLLHHAKLSAIRKAWHKEKEALKNGFAGTVEWTTSEIEEIMKIGYASNYEGDYIHDVQQYPELAEDPYNVKFTKKQTESSKKRRRKRENRKMCQKELLWFTWKDIC